MISFDGIDVPGAASFVRWTLMVDTMGLDGEREHVKYRTGRDGVNKSDEKDGGHPAERGQQEAFRQPFFSLVQDYQG